MHLSVRQTVGLMAKYWQVRKPNLCQKHRRGVSCYRKVFANIGLLILWVSKHMYRQPTMLCFPRTWTRFLAYMTRTRPTYPRDEVVTWYRRPACASNTNGNIQHIPYSIAECDLVFHCSTALGLPPKQPKKFCKVWAQPKHSIPNKNAMK